MQYADSETLLKIQKEGRIVLSIGTGHTQSTEPFVPPSSFVQGKLGYGVVDPLGFKAMEASERDSIMQARYVYKAIRLDPNLDRSLMPMDQSDPKHIGSLSKAANDFVVGHQKILKGYVECMIAEKGCEELITESTPNYSYEIAFGDF